MRIPCTLPQQHEEEKRERKSSLRLIVFVVDILNIVVRGGVALGEWWKIDSSTNEGFILITTCAENPLVGMRMGARHVVRYCSPQFPPGTVAILSRTQRHPASKQRSILLQLLTKLIRADDRNLSISLSIPTQIPRPGSKPILP